MAYSDKQFLSFEASRSKVDEEKIQGLLASVLELLGVNLEEEDFIKTPQRWAKSLIDITAGYDSTETEKISTVFLSECNQSSNKCHDMIVVKGKFFSCCAHHIAPFFGHFAVGYIPAEYKIGLSKIPRLVEYHSKKFQTQEKLAHNIADSLKEIVETENIAIWLGNSTHMCVSSRGVKDTSSETDVTVLSGDFIKDPTRSEFISHLNRFSLK